MSDSSTKICSGCGEEKPATLAHFNPHRQTRSGITQPCRECHKARMRVSNPKNYAKNREASLLKSYRSSDARSGLEATVTVEWMKENMTNSPCFYCETKDDPIGLDRLDNSKGHSEENVVPCCKICNKSRNNLFTPKEMLMLGRVIARIRKMRKAHVQFANLT